MEREIFDVKDCIQKYKNEIQDELNKRIKGYNLYHSARGKAVFKGKIIRCNVKCFKEYLQHNTVAIDIVTERDGETLTTATLVECLYNQDVGYDYFINKEEK